MRYFLFDRIIEITPEQMQAIKCVTLTDETLHDHFPEHPILPGALITEGLAQLAGYLLELHFNKDAGPGSERPIRRSILAQIEKMKFYNTSGPGDRLLYTAFIESTLEDAGRVRVEASCEGEIRAKGHLQFAMMKIDSVKVTEQRLYLYKLWTAKLANPPQLK